MIQYCKRRSANALCVIRRIPIGYKIAVRVGLIVAFVVSCHRSGAQSESLVGADSLPPQSDLVRETIQIRGRDGLTHAAMSYELTPSNLLSIQYSVDSKSSDERRKEQSFSLPKSTAAFVRTNLWRLRPAKLRGIEEVVYPTGCQPPLDAIAGSTVAFTNDKGEIGIVSVPLACKDATSAEARRILDRVIGAFPESATPLR